jgi:hypothetical protein
VKIGILLSMERVRLLSLDVQKAAGWSDEECQVAWNAVTAVVATPTSSSITRRDTNVGWLPLGDTVVFPTPGNFRYQVGPDSLTGTPDVLPLHVAVNSLTLSVDLTLSTDMPAESAFFLQGIDGITPGIPGLYYSYPQLTAAGSVTVEGVPYQVKGKGWIDHQLMLGVVPPAPYPPPPLLGYSGWSWCEFNFDNGDAYTSAAFQHGPFRVDPSSFYGFYLRRSGNAWEAEPVTGAIALDRFIPVLNFVMQPTSWTYTGASGTFPTPYPPVDFVVSTAPWTYDGSFQTPDLGIPSEVPVDALLVDRALGSDGLLNYQGVAGRGYCESVDFEPRAAYMLRAWTWLLASLL